jgi:anti-anti-sigma factor
VATLTVTALARSEGVAGLMGLFEAVSRSGAKHFVLDIQNLEYMDSACLGCLVKALNYATADGGKIALANAEADIQSLFRTTSLDRRFAICSDVPSALANVERPALRR